MGFTSVLCVSVITVVCTNWCVFLFSLVHILPVSVLAVRFVCVFDCLVFAFSA